MDISIFTDKSVMPDGKMLETALGQSAVYWNEISDYVFEQYLNAITEWKFPGVKYGWSFRIKDKKRVIVYLLPRENYFKAAFNFGQNAYEKIIDESSVPVDIKDELSSAKAYAEGRGIRIDVRDNSLIDVIKILIKIKLSC